jgi:hypothetical protein
MHATCERAGAILVSAGISAGCEVSNSDLNGTYAAKNLLIVANLS